MVALLDTGSDLYLIKIENYIKPESPLLTQSVISFKNLGRDCILTLRNFAFDVIMKFTIHLISNI